jgi:hypothetical protein
LIYYETAEISYCTDPAVSTDVPYSMTITSYRYELEGIDFGARSVAYSNFNHFGGGITDGILESGDSVIQSMIGGYEYQTLLYGYSIEGNILSLPMTWPLLIGPVIEQQSARSSADNSIHLLHVAEVIDAIPVGGQVITYERTQLVGVYPASEQTCDIRYGSFDEAELQTRVDIYNAENGTNITVADLEEGYVRYMHGDIDDNLFTDVNIDTDDDFVLYVRWYDDNH